MSTASRIAKLEAIRARMRPREVRYHFAKFFGGRDIAPDEAAKLRQAEAQAKADGVRLSVICVHYGNDSDPEAEPPV